MAKSCARVTPLRWNVILVGESLRDIAAWVLSPSWGGEGVQVKALPISSFGIASSRLDLALQ